MSVVVPVFNAEATLGELVARIEGVLTSPVRLEIVPGASHLFEEPGALEQVAELARDWFERHLVAARTRA